MSKHTDGPWRLNHNRYSAPEVNLWPAVIDNESKVSLGSFFIHDNDGEGEANARLIMSAPDLLDACKRALAELKAVQYPDDVDETWDETLAMVEAAIAKAEGGPP